MESIEIITAIVSLIIAIVTSVITILTKLKAIKNIDKAEKLTEGLIGLQHITDKDREFAIIAENNGGTGEEKKKFVLKSIEAISEELNWKYNEQLVTDILETFIDLSKKINSK